MDQQTIAGIRAAKRELEASIARLVIDFEKAVGVCVDGIDLSRAESRVVGGRLESALSGVHVELEPL